jgi:hypothetical protein
MEIVLLGIINHVVFVMETVFPVRWELIKLQMVKICFSVCGKCV